MHDERWTAGEACEHPCVLSRRAALQAAAHAVLGALLASGLAPALAQALVAAPRFVSGQGLARGNVKRYPIPAADGVQFDKEAEVILVRHAGHIYAFNLSCPHQNTALKWDDANGRFQCPKHKSKYQVDGTFISGRATRNMDRLGITQAGNDVDVDLDVMFKQDKQPAEWAAAEVTV